MTQQAIDWKAELDKTALKYHTIGSWVAILFNILFFVTDYINIHEFWKLFLTIRLVDSFIILLALLLQKKFKFSSEILVFVMALILSLQNAIMWSLMDAAHLQKHTMAYITLFIGAGMLVLWNIRYSFLLVALSVVANIITFSFYSKLTVEEILANGGLLTLSVAIFSILLINTRFNLTKKEIIARLLLEGSNDLLNKQKVVIEQKNKSITDSIHYAKRIQNAILPTEQYMKETMPEVFIYYRPRDIVSGDFYWYNHHNGKSFIAAVDCTGHGVPGAFMSMIGNTLLNKSVGEEDSVRPALILDEMKKEVIHSLQQGSNDSKDGMDIALCMVDHKNGILQYAGAFNPLYLVRNDELIIYKPNKMPVGIYPKMNEVTFVNHLIEIQKGDVFYIFSDGYADQFGGEDNRKFSSLRFRELLLSIHRLPMNEQRDALGLALDNWKRQFKQLDDILVIGFVPVP